MDCLMIADSGNAATIRQVISDDGRLILGAGESTVLEVNQLQQNYASVFAGDHVHPGTILFATHIDPLFLVHDLFSKARGTSDTSEGRFCDLDQIFDEDTSGLGALPSLRRAVSATAELICDVKEVSDTKYYRVNDEKFFAWLVAKCRQTATALQSAGGEGIRSLDEPARLLYAIGLLGEYISDVRHRALLKFFDLEAAAQEGEVLRTVDPVAFGDGGGGGSNKKPRLDPKEIARERAQQKAKEKKEEERKKIAKGSKPLTAFFTKKA